MRWSQIGLMGSGLCIGIALTQWGNLHGQTTVPVPVAPQQPAPVATPPARLNLPLAAVPRDPLSFRDVVKKVVPAVVSIEAKVAPRRVGMMLPPEVPDELRQFFEMAVPDLGDRGEPKLGIGSGVIVDPIGIIITNHHVVQAAEELTVTLNDGRKFSTREILRDPKTDLAVVKITSEQPFPALELGDSESMEVGDRVLAVGAPFGLTGSVTHGIISAKSRSNLKLNQYEDFLQTDAAINPGNSGGPLVNLEGKVIGINSAIKTKSGGFQGVGLAISSNLAHDVARQLIKHGTVPRGHLGISIRELDADLAQKLGVKKGGGVVVSWVDPVGPCSKVGMIPGDVITSIAGNPVTELSNMPRIVSRLPVNESIEMTVVREGKAIPVKVMVAPLPEEYPVRQASNIVPQGVTVGEIGITTTDLTPEIAAQLGYPRDARGAVVIGVERGSLAALAGLGRGAVIVRVDKTPIANTKQLGEALAVAMREKGALLYLLKPNGSVEFVVLKLK